MGETEIDHNGGDGLGYVDYDSSGQGSCLDFGSGRYSGTHQDTPGNQTSFHKIGRIGSGSEQPQILELGDRVWFQVKILRVTNDQCHQRYTGMCKCGW